MSDIKKDITIPSKEAITLVDYKAITFTLAGKDYGVNIMSVREISRGSRFTYVPNAPHFVRGVYNLRGEIIPVVDLRDFFGLPVEKTEKVAGILICRVKNTTLGLIVDSIEKVIGIDKKYIQPAHPMFAEINVQYIEGIINREDRLYVLLNIHQIFGITKEALEENHADEKNISTEITSSSSQQIPSSEIKTPKDSPESNPKISNPVIPQDKINSPSSDTSNTVLFIEPSQENNNSPMIIPSPEAQKLIDALNSMPEPNSETFFQPNIEEILANSPEFDNQKKFEGDDQTYTSLLKQLEDLINIKVTSINQQWIINKANNYLAMNKSLHLETEEEANTFLSGFFSKFTKKLWNEEILKELTTHLTPQDKGIFHVWNPGCANGYETFSVLAGILAYGISNTPKIYAQDIDLIAISEASHLIIQESLLAESFDLLVVEGSQGLQFKNEFKNLVIFEFADITHHVPLPHMDLIVARDVLSYLNEEEIDYFLNIASNVTKLGTLMVLGDHEILHHEAWEPLNSQYLSMYRKIK